jgi:hypothetical protein
LTQILLTSDQIRQFANAKDGVAFCDELGNIIVRVPPLANADETAIVAEAKRRLASDQPRHASADVLARLGSQPSQ